MYIWSKQQIYLNRICEDTDISLYFLWNTVNYSMEFYLYQYTNINSVAISNSARKMSLNRNIKNFFHSKISEYGNKSFYRYSTFCALSNLHEFFKRWEQLYNVKRDNVSTHFGEVDFECAAAGVYICPMKCLFCPGSWFHRVKRNNPRTLLRKYVK